MPAARVYVISDDTRYGYLLVEGQTVGSELNRTLVAYKTGVHTCHVEQLTLRVQTYRTGVRTCHVEQLKLRLQTYKTGVRTCRMEQLTLRLQTSLAPSRRAPCAAGRCASRS